MSGKKTSAPPSPISPTERTNAPFSGSRKRSQTPSTRQTTQTTRQARATATRAVSIAIAKITAAKAATAKRKSSVSQMGEEITARIATAIFRPVVSDCFGVFRPGVFQVWAGVMFPSPERILFATFSGEPSSLMTACSFSGPASSKYSS